jgi:ankyrin repeat protein
MTMLHCVAKYLEDKVDIVRDLLAVGADPTIKTSTGKDAYKLALKAGNEGVAAILKPLCQEEKRASE